MVSASEQRTRAQRPPWERTWRADERGRRPLSAWETMMAIPNVVATRTPPGDKCPGS